MSPGPSLALPGVRATTVGRATVDRLEWDHAVARSRACLPPGRVEVRPCARGRLSSIHLGTDIDGTACFVRRSKPRLLGEYAASHARVAVLVAQQSPLVPPLRHVDADGVWIQRSPWSQRAPRPLELDTYVASLVAVALATGVIVATGEPHVTELGAIVCEDVLVANTMEVADRHLIAGLLQGLAAHDAASVTDTVAELCRARLPRVAAAARRSTLALRVDWSPASLGLSLYDLACASAEAGPRSEPLVLLADELLHRLDLAHRHGAAVSALATPADLWTVVGASTVSGRSG
jgi:hypothetical protein